MLKRTSILIVAILLSPIATADFNFPDFSNPAGWGLVGDSVMAGNGLHIDLTLPQANQSGAIWSTALHDISGDFTATLTYAVVAPPGADGMALVIQAVSPNELATGQGGFLGYNGIAGAIAVELDMYNNSTFGDPNGNHISLHRNGDVMATGEVATNANVGAINTLGPHTLTLESVAGVLNVYFNGTTPVLTAPMNMVAEVGAPSAYIGVTAATGGLFHRHRLLSFSFSTGSGPVGPELIRGDCDDTGSVNIADAIWLLGHLFPAMTPNTLNCESACDANDDGGLNLVDAVAILNALFGTPPVPLVGPATCDVDPTADSLLCATSNSCP
ncbi:MAG: hypothetical protein AAF581_08000 [Planctomycetota bacterium]